VGVEALWRALRNLPPGGPTRLLEQGTIIAVVVASAGGLGIVVGGGAPADSLHYVYAAIALAIMPFVSSITGRLGARPRALVTLTAAIVALVVIVRLFQTG
jgi:hypothetical protein